MARLVEVEYEKIFSPKTMAGLKGKSGESLRSMLGNKSLMQTLMKSKEVLDEIIDAEEGYRDELEMIAAQMVTDAYPIIDYANIRIDAKIVGMGDMNIQPGEKEGPRRPFTKPNVRPNKKATMEEANMVAQIIKRFKSKK